MVTNGVAILQRLLDRHHNNLCVQFAVPKAVQMVPRVRLYRLGRGGDRGPCEADAARCRR